MNKIKCGYCNAEFSSTEIFQEHLLSCKKKIVKAGSDSTPFFSEPDASGRVYECKKCGASYRSKEGMLIHQADCF